MSSRKIKIRPLGLLMILSGAFSQDFLIVIIVIILISAPLTSVFILERKLLEKIGSLANAT